MYPITEPQSKALLPVIQGKGIKQEQEISFPLLFNLSDPAVDWKKIHIL